MGIRSLLGIDDSGPETEKAEIDKTLRRKFIEKTVTFHMVNGNEVEVVYHIFDGYTGSGQHIRNGVASSKEVGVDKDLCVIERAKIPNDGTKNRIEFVGRPVKRINSDNVLYTDMDTRRMQACVDMVVPAYKNVETGEVVRTLLPKERSDMYFEAVN